VAAFFFREFQSMDGTKELLVATVRRTVEAMAHEHASISRGNRARKQVWFGCVFMAWFGKTVSSSCVTIVPC
jgi:hypothetical protein